jgi:putative phosphoesterase
MKVALISDMHANLPALEAVLAHANSIGVKRFWCLGDFVQFNAFPQEVVRTVRRLKPVSIHGNVDSMVLEMKQRLKQTPMEELPEDEVPFAWTYRQLSKQSRKYIKGLPDTIKMKAKGYRFLLVHGSPAANDDPIYMDTPDDRLEELSQMTKADFILCGHTHKPFIREVHGVQFINPGSVGRPIDHDPRASYAVLNIKKTAVDVEFYRVEFNVSIAVQAIRDAGLPEQYALLVEAGISANDLQLQEQGGLEED